MSRPMLLVFLLLVLIITSQFEWKQQIVNDTKANPGVSEKQQLISKHEDTIKEKIILLQEKNIHKLNQVIRSLHQQLHQCRCNNETINGTSSSSTERAIELEQEHILDD